MDTLSLIISTIEYMHGFNLDDFFEPLQMAVHHLCRSKHTSVVVAQVDGPGAPTALTS
jgi:hypothetical protein